MSLNVLIIEDEAPAYRRLNTLLGQNHADLRVVELIDSVTEAIKWLRNHRSPDLIFSDIQLSDGLSFEIYEAVEIACPIIFTTAYDSYMLDAFKTNGIEYLLKPIQEDDLDRSIKKFRKFAEEKSSVPQMAELLDAIRRQEPKYKERFLIKLGTKLIPVQTEDVHYFYSAEGHTHLVLRSGKSYLVEQPLDELENQLSPLQFFRLNRQVLASVASIDQIHQYFKGKLKIKLSPPTEFDVVISREKSRSFKDWMDGEGF